MLVLSQWLMSQLQIDASFSTEQNVGIYYNFQTYARFVNDIWQVLKIWSILITLLCHVKIITKMLYVEEFLWKCKG